MNNSILRWEKDFRRTVVRLVIPITLQTLVMAVMHILDNVMIGKLGELQFAGVTQANRVTFLLQTILFGLVSGSSIFYAQYWGKRDEKGIKSLMGVSLMTALGVALVFAIPALCVPELLMSGLIKDPEAAAFGAQYLTIIGAVYVLDAYLMVSEAVLKSTEHVNLPMISGIVAVVTNTVLNGLLIFGSEGLYQQFGIPTGALAGLSRLIFGSESIPSLGVQGGAIATLCAVALQVLITVCVSYARRYMNAVKPRDLRLPPPGVVRKYYRTVLPVVINETFWSLGVVMYSVAYGRMSPGAVAAMSIFSNIEQFSWVALRGMTGACAILVGKSIGAGHPDEAQRDAKRFLLYEVLIGLVTGLLILLIAGRIVDWFDVSPETAASAREIIKFYAFFIWMSAGNSTLIVGVMRAGGDVVYSGLLDTVFLWVVGVPLVFAFGPVLGLPIQYVYLLTKTEEALKLIVGLWRLKSRKWIHNLVEDSVPL